MIDRAKVKAEARLDGKYLIATSDPHISAEDAALGYKNLLEAERGFRDLKSNLLLARLPPARTPHPRPRPDLLAGAAARPRRRTPHRVDLAAHRHRTRPRPRRRPHRQRRHRRPHHPTHHHPRRIYRGCQIPEPPAITALDPS